MAMRLPSLFRRTPFRLTLLFLALFAAAASAILAYVYVASAQEAQARARDAVEQPMRMLGVRRGRREQALQVGGEPGLVGRRLWRRGAAAQVGRVQQHAGRAVLGGVEPPDGRAEARGEADDLGSAATPPDARLAIPEGDEQVAIAHHHPPRGLIAAV
ncbi:MAG: hypothetical protein B7Z42_15715, partial [Brevundimonas sp. 12-68-7]